MTVTLKKRSLSLSSHRTSIALEPEFWQALEQIAHARGLSLNGLIAEIDSDRPQGYGLAQATRIYTLKWFRGSDQE